MIVQIQEQSRLIHAIYQNLISIKNEDGQSRYELQASFLLYRIPIWNYPTKSKSSTFKIFLSDLTKDTKQALLSLPSQIADHILKEAVANIFTSLGERQMAYFESRVKDQLEVELI